MANVEDLVARLQEWADSYIEMANGNEEVQGDSSEEALREHAELLYIAVALLKEQNGGS